MIAADFKQPVTINHLHGFSAYLTWGQPTVGFGEYSLRIVDGKLEAIDAEGMSKEWARRALYAAVDAALEEAYNTDGRSK